MFTRTKTCLLTLVFAALPLSASHASTLTETFTVSGAGWGNIAGSTPATGGPFDLSFTATFDPTQSLLTPQTGIVNSVTIAGTQPLSYAYETFGGSGGLLNFQSGGTGFPSYGGQITVDGTGLATILDDANFSLGPTEEFDSNYTPLGSPFGTASVSGAISPVPLPGTVGMFGSALVGMIGLAGLRRKSTGPIAA